MTSPRWMVALLTWLAPADQRDDVVGDLEEAHRARVARRGRAVAALLTAADALDMGFALGRERWRRRHTTHPAGMPFDPVPGFGRGTAGFVGSPLDHLRHAVRRLRRSAGFTVTATLTLALGIGLSTAVFTI